MQQVKVLITGNHDTNMEKLILGCRFSRLYIENNPIFVSEDNICFEIVNKTNPYSAEIILWLGAKNVKFDKIQQLFDGRARKYGIPYKIIEYEPSNKFNLKPLTFDWTAVRVKCIKQNICNVIERITQNIYGHHDGSDDFYKTDLSAINENININISKKECKILNNNVRLLFSLERKEMKKFAQLFLIENDGFDIKIQGLKSGSPIPLLTGAYLAKILSPIFVIHPIGTLINVKFGDNDDDDETVVMRKILEIISGSQN